MIRPAVVVMAGSLLAFVAWDRFDYALLEAIADKLGCYWEYGQGLCRDQPSNYYDLEIPFQYISEIYP